MNTLTYDMSTRIKKKVLDDFILNFEVISIIYSI